MSDINVSIQGMEGLAQTFEDLVRHYPDKAGNLLRRSGRDIRNKVIENVKRDTDFNESQKQSLSKTSSYNVSQVKGFGAKQYVEVSAKAPHFHLVEHGHQMVTPRSRSYETAGGNKKTQTLYNGGQNVGFVQGKHMMEKAVKVHERIMPLEVDAMVDELLKEAMK